MSSLHRPSFASGLLAAAVVLAGAGFQTPDPQTPSAVDTGGLAVPTAFPDVILRTDYTNYAPGEVVIFTSSGWSPGEAITLFVREEPPIHPIRVLVGRADSFGELFDNQFIAHAHDQPVAYFVTARGDRSGRSAITTFGNTSVNLDQCANGSAGNVACTGSAWQNGSLNSNQARYLEGQSIPYRDVFSGVSPGITYTKTISWDTTKSGKHAIDYLTSWNRNVVGASSPCSGVLNPCPAPTPWAIPVDTNLAANGFNGSPVAGQFLCYGCNISTVSTYSLSGTYAGDSSTSITITFTASLPNAVIAWGGHISDRRDWGLTNTAVTIPGSPYHMADVAFTCSPGRCSTGKQDRSISAEAVVFPAKLTVVKDTDPDGDDSFDFTTTGGLTPSTFSLVDDGGGTSSNTRVFSDITTFGQYTVTESDPAPFTLTGLTCTDDVTTNAVGTPSVETRTATIPLAEGQFVTCTFTNTAPEQCGDDSDCTGTPATPVCDPDTNTCVGCITSSDCTAGEPVCNQETHTCGDCTTDAQCQGYAATPVCNAAGSCSECDADSHELCTGEKPLCDTNVNGGICVGCITNSDCTAGEPVCNQETHTCGDCTTDAECQGYAATPVCNAAGSCSECDADSHELCTGEKPLCDTNVNGGICVGCITNSDCTAGEPVCNQETHTCGDCTTDAQCQGYAATPVCNAAGSCSECDADSHELCTGEKPLCDTDVNGGICVGCITSSDCTAGEPVCNQETHTCGDCTTDAQCQGYAATPVCNAAGSCSECDADSHELCTGEKPLCDTNVNGGICVGCITNSDCTAGEPVCNQETHTCGDCTTDAQCQGYAATPVCNAAGSCSECDADSHELCTGEKPLCDTNVNGGICVGCITNSDCTAGEPVCNQETHTCGDCTTDAECQGFAATPVCNAAGSCSECDADSHELCTGEKPLCDTNVNGGICVGCITNSDCTAGEPVCNQETHTCGDCTTDAECQGFAATPFCDVLSGRCTECKDDEDCGGAHCETSEGICVQCLENNDCPAGAPSCVSNKCTGCDSDEDCTGFPSTPTCSIATGICVECVEKADCTNPEEPVCNGGDGTCVECLLNSDCSADEPVCNQETHTCGACTTDDACSGYAATPVCNEATGKCSECDANSDVLCTGDEPVCNSETGQCVGCVTSSDCPETEPVCDQTNHTCGGCTDDSDCTGFPGATACSETGTCTECNSNDDCSFGAFCGSEGTCHTVPADGKIAPTATTCEQYRLGTAGDLTEVLYGVKGSKINNVAPGVLFYYTYLSDLSAGSNEIRVDQTRQLKTGDPLTPFFGVHQSQVSLYNASDCSTSSLRASVGTGSGEAVTINVSGAAAGQDLIVGIKYNPGSVTGTTVSAIRPVVHYNFVTSLNGTSGQTDPDGLDLKPKP